MFRVSVLSLLCLALLATLVASASGLEQRAVQMKEDYGSEPLTSCYLSYYYYIPCTPVGSWFWTMTNWHTGDKVGAWFRVGDPSMGTVSQCDATNCQQIDKFRVLDFAGAGTYAGGKYAGLFTVEFDIYCADADGCPVGPSLWNSGPWETDVGWNYIPVNPPLSICRCDVVPSQPASAPRILVVATHTGTLAIYPMWGLDNVSRSVELGCAMHDIGCLPALYPRPYVSNYSTMHSGYYGNGSFQYCPPRWFKDQGDSTPAATRYGYVELAWRIYLSCTGPSATVPTTWGTIKSMYR